MEVYIFLIVVSNTTKSLQVLDSLSPVSGCVDEVSRNPFFIALEFGDSEEVDVGLFQRLVLELDKSLKVASNYLLFFLKLYWV